MNPANPFDRMDARIDQLGVTVDDLSGAASEAVRDLRARVAELEERLRLADLPGLEDLRARAAAGAARRAAQLEQQPPPPPEPPAPPATMDEIDP